MRGVVVVSVLLALATACRAFDSAPTEERDAATADAGRATDSGADGDIEGAAASDAGADARSGYACVERAPLVFASLSACEAASAPSASDCPLDAGQPTGGEPCSAPVTWCSCVESSTEATVVLHVKDCSCMP